MAMQFSKPRIIEINVGDMFAHKELGTIYVKKIKKMYEGSLKKKEV
jgi:hypothetical protein